MSNMRVLLLTHNDNPEKLQNLQQSFDVIFDLSASCLSSCQHWSELIRCPVKPVPKSQFTDLRLAGKILDHGVGHVIDDLGDDWWDLISIEYYEQMLEIIRLERFVSSCDANAEFFVMDSGFCSRVLKCIAPGRVHEFTRAARVARQRVTRLNRHLRLRPSQILQILGDKYDSNYRFRRLLESRTASRESVVLLPSAYGNASSTALGYARILPDQRFLLVATRRSGRVKRLPENVVSSSLASYAPANVSSRELQRLLLSWHGLLREFCQDRALSILSEVGCFDSVPQMLQQGLFVRDAWLAVFASEPVLAVLSADEMNWHTRLPLMIARARGLPNVACHHGALDRRYSLRETSTDCLLVKGSMERNYVTEVCCRPANQVQVGAPSRTQSTRVNHQDKNAIIFFSEPYEHFGQRCRERYQQVLPGLAKLADSNGRDLILKIHPFENRHARKHLAEDLLGRKLGSRLTVIDGPLDGELLARAWFGVTITSTAGLDCALQRVPVFMCKWLDSSNSLYAEQFIRFGVAKELPRSDAISEIPRMLENFPIVEQERIWQTIRPERLRELLSGIAENRAPDVQMVEAESAWA